MKSFLTLAKVGSALAVATLLTLSGCSSSAGNPTATTTTPPLAAGGDGPTTHATTPAASTATTTATTSAPAWPTPEDCVTYNPNTVTVHYEAGIWAVSDGGQEVLRVHGGPADNVGQQGLALAQRYGKRCYIGRANTRTQERDSFIFDYFRDPSGKTTTIPDEEDACSSYNRGNLTVENMGGGDGWRVKDHDHVLHLFDNQADANNGKLVLAKFSQICFIGITYDTDNGQDVVSYEK